MIIVQATGVNYSGKEFYMKERRGFFYFLEQPTSVPPKVKIKYFFLQNVPLSGTR
jgi:hypothetical protein